ncbi:hypothetical protein S83_003425, partial [Arachis hypogaea]
VLVIFLCEVQAKTFWSVSTFPLWTQPIEQREKKLRGDANFAGAMTCFHKSKIGWSNFIELNLLQKVLKNLNNKVPKKLHVPTF